ncbi:MAG: hypothetical protein JXB32_22045 [Deltaproteobacteria bacterium]|nr:hypothetical protein [Deltaproteobacteria bacterium]
MTRATPAALVLLLAGCSVGSGEGWVRGEIFLPVCGYPAAGDDAGGGSSYELAVRYLFGDVVDDTIDIRLQDSGVFVDRADGLVIHVRNRHDVVEALRAGGPVVVPVYSEYPPLPVTGPDLVVRMSLYLNGSCTAAFPDFGRGVGQIEFTSMYARTADGDHANIDRIRGTFTGVEFRDERPEVAVDGAAPWARIDGSFDFDYTRGRPAQPFP